MWKRPDVVRCVGLMAALAWATPFGLAAQDTHRCASEADPVKRLACYDQAFPPPPTIRAEAAQKAKQDFGLAERPAPLRNPGQTVEETDPSRIESRVVRVDHDGGQRRVTLENGQVWRQTDATSGGNMVVGDVVVVRKGALGSFLLVTPAGTGLRVRRVR